MSSGRRCHFERALSIFEELRDVKRQGDVLTYYGAMAYWEGRWADAVELYERGRQRSERAGDVVGAAIAAMNVAEVLSDQGRLEEAEGPAREALRVFQASRHAELIATDCSILGRMASRAGRHDQASELLTEALRLAEGSGSQLLAIGGHAFIAEDLLRKGDTENALDAVARARRLASQIGGAGIYEALLERVEGGAHLIRGDLGRAAKALDASLASARAAGSAFEILLTLAARRALSDAGGEGSPPEEDAEAASIAERLGVVTVASTLPAFAV